VRNHVWPTDHDTREGGLGGSPIQDGCEVRWGDPDPEVEGTSRRLCGETPLWGQEEPAVALETGVKGAGKKKFLFWGEKKLSVTRAALHDAG